VSGVSLRRPDNAKPKGRTISDTEKELLSWAQKETRKKKQKVSKV
jgi:hypothetical protein